MSRLQRLYGALIAGFGLLPGIAGCVVYETAPGVYSPAPPSTFDRSYAAAVGAFADEGVQIVSEDRATGAVRGHLGETLVAADVVRQADGSVKVEFGASGKIAANPSLKDRIIRSYNRRMGR